jgi:ATP-dependent protease ClpP protease subunit
MSEDGTAIFMAGVIDDGACELFDLIQQENPEATAVWINSPGGSVREGMCIASIVDYRALDTRARNAFSAASYVWRAGTNRTLMDGGKVADHGISGAYVVMNAIERYEQKAYYYEIFYNFWSRTGYDHSHAAKFAKISTGSNRRWTTLTEYRTK